MCKPVRNSWSKPAGAMRKQPAPRRSSEYVGFRSTVFKRNHSTVSRASGSISQAPHNWNVCRIEGGGGGPNLADPWEPGNLGRIVLTVSNSNSVIDDSWDFKINGVTVCNYDGGGATTVQFSTNLPPGIVLSLEAECVGEQSDNYFTITVTVDGNTVIDTSISGEGTVGEVVGLGTFNT